MKVSRTFVAALKLAEQPAYKIAQRAGVHPAVLSRLIHGAEPVRAGDERILRVAALLGVPADEALEAAPEGDHRC